MPKGSYLFDDDTIRDIFLDPDNGHVTAEKHNCSPSMVSLIRRRVVHPEVTEGLVAPQRKWATKQPRKPNVPKPRNIYLAEDTGVIIKPEVLELAQSRAW